MRNLSSKFRHEMYYNHTFDCLAEITLVNNTKLTLTNTELWTGGFTQDDSVSQDSSFTALGAAVIGSASVIINNMDETYSEYDFTNAKVNLSLSKTYEYDNRTVVEPIQMGVYTVDDTQYNGATITLSLLDNMEQFDRPYNTNLQYPATLITIVEDACLNCGVQLGTLTFPHQEYEVQVKPDKDDITYRQVISWAATIAGCFARCDVNGKLELKWFDTSLIDAHTTGGLDGGEFDSSRPYSTGDTADGGSFNPWNTGYVIDDGSFETVRQLHYLTRLFSQNIGVDDVVITGVKVIVEVEDSTTNQRENREYLTGTNDYVIEVSENEFITPSTAQSISTWLGNQLIGLRFRNGSVTHVNDPSLEAGDVAIVIDRKGREYPFLITRTSFSASGNQTTECNAESASRNSATQFSQATKAYVKARKLLNKEQTAREQAIQDLAEGLAAKSGLYSTVDTTQSGNIYYLHDKPLLADSKIVWKMTSNAFGVTTDYKGSNPEQTVWNAGLTVDGTLIAQIIDTIKINFDRGTGGTLTLGGQDNVNGLLRMLDANGVQVGEWRNTGLTAKSLTADNYVYVDGNDQSVIRIPFNITNDYQGYIELSTNSLIIKNTKGVYNNNITFNQWTRYYNRPFPYFYPQNAGYSDSYGVLRFSAVDGTEQHRVDIGMIGTDEYANVSGQEYTTVTHPGYLKITGTDGSFEALTDTVFGSTSQVRIQRLGLVITDSNVQVSGGNFTVVEGDIETVRGSNLSSGNVKIRGNAEVWGTKSRLAETKDYGERLLYCYETPTPMFGDIGEGVINDDGQCYIIIDPTFAETVSTTQYQVFLQKYGNGECYVLKRTESYFIVEGTPGLSFGWEIKAKQTGYEERRLDTPIEITVDRTNYSRLANEHIDKTQSNYGDMAVEHIEDIAKEREVAA